MSERKRSKIAHEAVPYDLLMIIGGKHRRGGGARSQTKAKLPHLSTAGLAALWNAIIEHAAPSVIRQLAAQGCNAESFPAIVRALYRQEQPRRADQRWSVIMKVDEAGIRVMKRLRRFMVIATDSQGA